MSKRSPEREDDIAGGDDDQPAAKQPRQDDSAADDEPEADAVSEPEADALAEPEAEADGVAEEPERAAAAEEPAEAKNDDIPPSEVKSEDKPAAETAEPAARGKDENGLDKIVNDKLQELYNTGVCTKGDVDNRALEHLKAFPAKTAIEILDQFKNSDLSTVRNRSAYLSGVMGRFRKHDGDGPPPGPGDRNRDSGGRGPPGGGMDRGGAPPPLSRMVQRMLDDIYRARNLPPGTLDQRCLNALASLPVNQAETALEQLETQDLSQIRSIPAWFMSIVKRAGRGEHGQDFTRGPPGRGPGGPGHGAFPAQPPPPRGPPPRGGHDYGYGRGDFDMGHGGPPGMPMMGGPGFNGGMPGRGMPPPPPPGGMGGGMGGMMAPGGAADHSMAQISLGVRVDEFHNLSLHAPAVHAAPALKLQQLWDEGCRLVSLLDDRAWEALAALGAPEALVVIDEVADNMIRNADNIRNINALFMSVANKYLRPGGDRPGGGGYNRDDRSGPRPGGGRDLSRDRERDSRDGGRDSRQRNDGPGDMSSLPSSVCQRIDQLMQTHGRFISHRHFDSGIVNALKQIGEDGCLQVIDEIASNDMGNVRNPAGYMMGIISRYLRGERGGRH